MDGRIMSRRFHITIQMPRIWRLVTTVLIITGATSGFALMAAPAAGASTGDPTRTVSDPADTSGDLFGSNVAVSGSTAVVGAPGPGTPTLPEYGYSWTPGSGTAYIYVKGAEGWPATPAVTLPDPADTQGDAFGGGANSVAVSGNTIIIGAYGTSSGEGAAYVYVRGPSGWPTTPTVTLPDPAATEGDDFGFAVSLAGRTAIIGAPGGDAAYVYHETGSVWPTTPTATLEAPAAGLFGWAVSISRGTAVVGAYGAGSPSRAGQAYLYVNGPAGWPTTPTVTLQDPQATADDLFGSDVAVSRDTVLISDVGDGADSSAVGTAYLYVRGPSGWPTTPTVTLPDPADHAGDLFSASLAISGNVALVGDGAYSGTDAVYAYVRGPEGWPSAPSLTLPDPLTPPPFPGDGFGQGLSISGTSLLIGAPRVNSDAGVAYFFCTPSWLPCQDGDSQGTYNDWWNTVYNGWGPEVIFEND
jgi:hypothetical protein